MIAGLGHTAIFLALILALTGSALSFLGGVQLRRAGVSGAVDVLDAFGAGDAGLVRLGRVAAFAAFACVALAVGVMISALVTHDFSVSYVAEVGSKETPLYYTVISLWAALEGSILFWALVLSAYTALFLLILRRRFLQLQPCITGTLLAILSFFLFVIVGPGNPFKTLSPAPADGPGPNPLLQNHPMMGLHPPLLYLGYVGLAVPYAIAMAGLIRGNLDVDVLRLIRRWALIPWVFLSLGIVAGMWWSYAVLGWGGFWSWDPVENASVMPWLVTTAFLHSLQVQERRRMLKVWTVSLIVAAFLLSILGTFFTRSGVVASVHSFTQSAIGPLFLGFLAILLVASLALLLGRSSRLEEPGALNAAICRESAFLFNNLLFVALTFTILLGTVFPLIAEATQGTQLSVGAPYFNHVAVPIGIALLFLMGVGPVLPWGMARMEDLQWRLLPPIAIGVAIVLLLLALGVRGIGTLATFGLAGFVIAVTLGRFVADARSRLHGTGEGWIRGAGGLLASNPRRYGGYLVHIGVILAVVGIAASQTYGVRALQTLRPGQSMSLDGYTLRFAGFHPVPQPNRMVMQARVTLSRSGRDLGMLTPSQNYYPTLQQPVVTPAVREQPFDFVLGAAQGRNPLPEIAPIVQRANPFEDVYVVLDGVNVRSRSATLLVLVNPMIGLIWLGGMLMGLGGVFALIPARRRRRVPAAVPEPVRLQPEEVTA